MALYGVSFVATVFAWDTVNNTYKTGDAANIALRWLKDGTDAATTNACSEVSSTNAPGEYKVTITATEAQCLSGTLGGKSSTSGVVIIPITFTFEQLPNAAPGASGGLVIAGSNAATTFATLTSTGAFSINGTSTVAQTGDSFARIGATGSGLTSLAPSATALSTVQWTNTRAALLDNADAPVSSRMATYTQPTGFLAATFPLTVASTTNITAGTITTVTNLTNAPTNGDFTAVMKTSLNAATPSVTVSDKTGFSLTAAYDAAKTAAQAGDAMTLTIAYDAAKTAAQSGDPMALVANAVDATAVAATGAAEIATAVGALSLGASNNNYTLVQGLTIVLSAVAGKVSGEDVGAPAFRDLADAKNVISGTDDGSGNRLTITYNP